MTAEERLQKFMERGGVSFSVETLPSSHVLITITRSNGSSEDTVGGTYDDIDQGINECLDQLEDLIRRNSIKRVK